MKKLNIETMPVIRKEYRIQDRIVSVVYKYSRSVEVNGHDEDHMTEQDKLDFAKIEKQSFLNTHLKMLQKNKEFI